MWILVMITVLSAEPLNIMYDSIAKIETLKQCQTVADNIIKHNPNSTLICVSVK